MPLTHRFVALFLFVLIAFTACKNERKSYRLKGTLSQGDTLYLAYDSAAYPGNNPTPSDTAVLRDGNFEFNGTVPFPMHCILFLANDDSPIASFIIENSELTLDTTINQVGQRIVRGSRSQDDADEIENMRAAFLASRNYTLDSLADLPSNSKKQRDSLLDAASKAHSKAAEAYAQKVNDYVNNHSSSYGALYGWNPFPLWSEGSPAIAMQTLEQFDLPIRSTPRAKRIEKEIRKYESWQNGQPAPELKLKDDDGNFVTLATYKGKRVIFFAQPIWDLSEEDYLELSKLANTVMIAANPNKTWSKLKYLNVNSEPGGSSPYYGSLEASPWVYVIDENGLISGKGYKPWKGLQ
jgi:hypothetical protein